MLVMTAGTTAALPVAPLYISHRGGGSAGIALFVGGPLVVSALVQIPAGRLADRCGRRLVLAAALAAYTVLSVPLFLSIGSLWQLCLIRCAQGLCLGAYQPALRAALSDRSTAEHRAAALSRLQAVTQVGFFAGPIIGGFLATVQESAIFACGGAATLLCLIALAPVRDVKPGRPAISTEIFSPSAASHPATRPVWRSPGFVLCCSGLAANMLVLNAYEITWPQYMNSRGFGTVVIGASLALYALPLAFLSVWGGPLIDRLRPRMLLGCSFLATGACAATYPALHLLAVILIVNALEAAATVAIQPGLYAAITRSARPGATGRALGVAGAFEGGGGAVGATALGALYGVSAGLPFWVSGVILGCVGIACAIATPKLSGEAGAPPAVPERVTVRIRTGNGDSPATRHRREVAAATNEQLAILKAELAEWMAYAERVAEARVAFTRTAWARERELVTVLHHHIVKIQQIEAELDLLRTTSGLDPGRIRVLAG